MGGRDHISEDGLELISLQGNQLQGCFDLLGLEANLLNKVLLHVREPQEVGFIVPAALLDALHGVHDLQSCTEEAIISHDVDHGLQNTNRLVQDRLQVGDVVRHRERHPLKMGLEQQHRLGVGALEGEMLWLEGKTNKQTRFENSQNRRKKKEE